MQLSSSKKIVDLEIEPLGDKLAELLGSAQQQVLLSAPYIKNGAFIQLLDSIDRKVELTCFTRWRPHEIAAGVSDVEVYETLTKFGGSLYLVDNLHAKYYRADDRILLGSANLTARGLGWSSQSNLELLVGSKPTTEVSDFELLLQENAVLVDDEIFHRMKNVSQYFVKPKFEPETPEVETKTWLPKLRNPQTLFQIYTCKDLDSLPKSTVLAGLEDLGELNLPPNLKKDEFYIVVPDLLLLKSSIQRIDQYVNEPRRFGEVRSWLQDRLGLSRTEAVYVWQTTIRWFRYYLPNRYQYSRPRFSEIIQRIDAEPEKTT